MVYINFKPYHNTKIKDMKINTTIDIEEFQVTGLQNYLQENLNVLDFKVIPDTSKLYEEDECFRRLCKSVKNAQIIRDKYWNDKRI